jgi:hypothetical protein
MMVGMDITSYFHEKLSRIIIEQGKGISQTDVLKERVRATLFYGKMESYKF